MFIVNAFQFYTLDLNNEDTFEVIGGFTVYVLVVNMDVVATKIEDNGACMLKWVRLRRRCLGKCEH